MQICIALIVHQSKI